MLRQSTGTNMAMPHTPIRCLWCHTSGDRGTAGRPRFWRSKRIWSVAKKNPGVSLTSCRRCRRRAPYGTCVTGAGERFFFASVLYLYGEAVQFCSDVWFPHGGTQGCSGVCGPPHIGHMGGGAGGGGGGGPEMHGQTTLSPKPPPHWTLGCPSHVKYPRQPPPAHIELLPSKQPNLPRHDVAEVCRCTDTLQFIAANTGVARNSITPLRGKLWHLK